MDDDDHSMSDAAPVPQPTWQWRPPPNWPPAPPGWLPPPGWMPPPNWPPPPAGWSFWQADTADHWEWPEPTGPVVLPEGKLRSSLVWETRFVMVAFLVPTVTAAVVLFAKHVSGVGTVTRFPVIVANPVTNLVLGILSYGSVAAVVPLTLYLLSRTGQDRTWLGLGMPNFLLDIWPGLGLAALSFVAEIPVALAIAPV
ncbi:MAG: hypothetical protein JO368_08835, partial [Acidimicrobiales bacterium]|nr:hypothetical protein [Acidimicrobiales bacterium]